MKLALGGSEDDVAVGWRVVADDEHVEKWQRVVAAALKDDRLWKWRQQNADRQHRHIFAVDAVVVGAAASRRHSNEAAAAGR